MNATELLFEMRPDTNSGLYGIGTHDLCNTDQLPYSWWSAAPVSQRSWVQIPYGPEFFQVSFQLLVQ